MNKKKIIERIKREFPGIYFDLVSHDAHGHEFEVRGFGAERSEFRFIRRKIMDINDELFPDFDVTLITILFTKETTSEIFPEIAVLLEEGSCCDPTDPFRFLEGVLKTPSGTAAKFLMEIDEDEPINMSPAEAKKNAGWLIEGNAIESADDEYALAA